jgi:hypothetical protein
MRAKKQETRVQRVLRKRHSRLYPIKLSILRILMNQDAYFQKFVFKEAV